MGKVMTQELGRLEDLPVDYVQDLRDLNLVPLWPSLRGVLPPHIPTRQTRPIHWPYLSIKALLLKAGELTPIEKAERRVLVLANPGHGLDKSWHCSPVTGCLLADKAVACLDRRGLVCAAIGSAAFAGPRDGEARLRCAVFTRWHDSIFPSSSGRNNFAKHVAV